MRTRLLQIPHGLRPALSATVLSHSTGVLKIFGKEHRSPYSYARAFEMQTLNSPARHASMTRPQAPPFRVSPSKTTFVSMTTLSDIFLLPNYSDFMPEATCKALIASESISTRPYIFWYSGLRMGGRFQNTGKLLVGYLFLLFQTVTFLSACHAE